MNLREDMIKLSGGEVLTEGVKYFKFSKRIDKLLDKVNKSKEDQKTKELIVKNFAIVRKDFKNAEDVFASGNEEEGKKLYKAAKIKNAGIMNKILRKDVLSFLLKAGVLSLIAGLAAFLANDTLNDFASQSQNKLDGRKISEIADSLNKQAEKLFPRLADKQEEWKRSRPEWKEIQRLIAEKHPQMSFGQVSKN